MGQLTAEAHSASASSQDQHVATSELDSSPPKSSTLPTHSFTVAVDPTAEPYPHSPLRKRFWVRSVRVRFPALYERAQAVINFIRGPRPKVDLPERTPFLCMNVHIGRRQWSLSVEPAIIRATRPFCRSWLLVLFGTAYIVSLAFITRSQFYLTPMDSLIGCTSTYWLSNDGCGLNGVNCIPTDGENFEFRCPAQCKSVILANPRTIGNTQVDRVPLVVGGGDTNRTYRGDSFICAAAMHAGMFENSRGGCAALRLTGNFTNFLTSTAHGLTSAAFASIFPIAFRLERNSSLGHCEDLRDVALIFNIIITAILFLVLRPKPLVLFWTLVCIGFWHVTLFSQPRGEPPPLDEAFGTFLPTLFVAYAFWRISFQFVLPAFSKAPLERSVWYLPIFWTGVLFNVVTEGIPVDRLLASDIQRTPGALTAVVIVSVVLLIIVINQMRVIRKTGWLPYYLGWYILGGLVALILALLPGLQFRLHHYIAAIVLIPGTAFPTRLSAIYQAFLLGMFLNGVAAFGYDSILQTAAALRRDATFGTSIPTFLTNSSTFNTSIPLQDQVIFWETVPDTDEGWNGYSLLVDDVGRYMGPALNFSLASLQAGIPHFFRLAFQRDGISGDFTMPATLWPNGTWTDPLPGST